MQTAIVLLVAAAALGVGCASGAVSAPSEPAPVVTVRGTPERATAQPVDEAEEPVGVEEGAEPESVPQGVEILELVLGTGRAVQPKSRVVVHYVGLLEDGAEFDSTYKRGQPMELPLGIGALIKGFEQGLVGMRMGGKRRVTIPFELAYGERGRPPTIPPRATLVFEIELMDVK